MSHCHLISKRHGLFTNLGLPHSTDISALGEGDCLLIDKRLAAEQDPIIRNLPANVACYFIEPATLDASYDLVSEIVMPSAVISGLFTIKPHEPAGRVRFFHKSQQPHDGSHYPSPHGAKSNK